MFANDPEIQEWVYGILHGEPEPAGDFLLRLAEAVTRADVGNYALLRPALVVMGVRYPKYKCTCQRWK